MKLNGIIHDHPDKDGETFSAELQPNDVIVLYVRLSTFLYLFDLTRFAQASG